MKEEQSGTDPFSELSDEYAQALEAIDAIEKQAELFVALGRESELRTFLERFNEMARQARAKARAQQLDHFVEWFDELIRRVESVEQKAFP